MPDVRIKTTGKKLLRASSRDAVRGYFSSLTPIQRCREWIAKSNRYRVKCIHQYAADLTVSPSAVDHAALSAYIAASGPGHVIDGWSLLGRAIDSALRNDVYGALHLGYYAELRAAMALLACEGVGIFSNRHPIVDRCGTSHCLPKVERRQSNSVAYSDFRAGTHAIVWPCLKHWSQLAKSFDVFEEVFRPADLPLSEWLSRLRSTASARAISKKWLQLWGLDLSIMEDDHESRNLASYRPSEFRLPPMLPFAETLEDVTEIWLSLEPSSYGTFLTLERQLLKRGLAAGGISTPLPAGSLSALGIGQAEESAWLAVFNAASTSKVISLAEGKSQIDQPGAHLQVVARACLLLFLATALSRKNLSKAGYTRKDLSFWWHRHGVERGYWNPSDIVDPISYWADVRDLLSHVAQWRTQSGNSGTLREYRDAITSDTQILGAFELAGMWGLLP